MKFVSVADDDSCGTKGGFKTRPYKLRDRDLLWVRNLRDADVDERISSLDFVSRLAQRRFVYLVAVCVLDPNLRPLLPPFLRFENGVAEIVTKRFGDVSFALDFDFPGHKDHLWSASLRWSIAIPYCAFELSQHAIEYETRIPGGIFVRHVSIHAQKRIAIFFE